MANIFQKFFRPEYQWQLMDLVKECDIKEEFCSFDTDHITPCGHPVFGKGSTRKYSLHTEDTYMVATRFCDTALNHPISVSLYVHRKRKNGDKRNSEHREKDTEFAYKMYALMRNKYITEREFTW